MHKSERPRMKHRTLCFNLRTGVVANVHAFPDQWMTEFGHVDSNLMLASGFKAAFDQRGAHKARNRSDMRNRTPLFGRRKCPYEPRIPSPRSKTRCVSTRVAVTAPCAMA